jgi:CheY-like chemotaxis protein
VSHASARLSDPLAAATDPARRVLLVEDDDEVALATGAVLERHGWSVVRAADAESALEMLDNGDVQPDVVLTDISMPGEFDGEQLAVHLRQTRPDLRVVLMTGHVGMVHRAAAGGFELLPKPCPPRELLEALAGRR